MYPILIILGVVAVIGVIAFLVLRSKKVSKEQLTVRHAISVAKAALLDKENLPEIFRRMKDKTEVPYDAKEENKAKAEIPGTYHLRWPHVQVGYVLKDTSEKIVLQIDGYDKVATLFYGDGELNGVKMGEDSLGAESFDMRHAGTLSEQLRAFVRYHVRFPGGSLKVDKAPEPTFKPVLDLKKAGEIHLKGPPPPGKMPNFEE